MARTAHTKTATPGTGQDAGKGLHRATQIDVDRAAAKARQDDSDRKANQERLNKAAMAAMRKAMTVK